MRFTSLKRPPKRTKSSVTLKSEGVTTNTAMPAWMVAAAVAGFAMSVIFSRPSAMFLAARFSKTSLVAVEAEVAAAFAKVPIYVAT